MVVSPRYLHGDLSDNKFAGAINLNCGTKVHCFGGIQEVDFFHEYRAGVDWVFVDHPSYHRPGNPYGDIYGAFGDNQFRFTLLCQAACEAPLVLPLGGFTYGEKCLFLANDWHAGLVPVLLAAKYRPNGVYKDARSIIAIHNLAHQGVEPAATYGNLGLPMEWYGALEWVFPTWARTHALDTGQAVNILKGAIVTADRILTVSKILDLSRSFPELKSLRSCDLLSSSWLSLAWYPIYRIPMGPTLKDLDACFLTFHSLHTPMTDTMVQQAAMAFKLVLLMYYRNGKGHNFRRQGQLLTLFQYGVMLLYRAFLPAPLWYRFFLNKEYGSLFLSLTTGMYLTFKLTSIVEKVGSFWTALKALSRKEVHYGSYATLEHVIEARDLCVICQENIQARVLL